MRALDPRLVPHLRPARRPLLLVLGGSLADGVLTVAQAFAVAALVVAVVTDPGGTGWQTVAWWVFAVVGLRALASYVVDVAAASAGGRVSVALRHRLTVAATRMDGPSLSRHRVGELALLATRGVAAIEPYFTRYLPALVLASVLPPATLVAIFWLDWVSGVIVLCTLPLVPLYAILIGTTTRDRARRQWHQLAALSGHFLDVVRGLPTLVAYRRATAQSSTIRTVTDRYRTATADTLKLAFASSGVLELVATLSVALVAVAVGLRLAAGSLDFGVALTVLLLAPEAYWPLRRVGAEFHAAAEGTASFGAIDAVLASEPSPATVAAEPPHGSIELDRLTVAYDGRTVIDSLSTTFASPGLTAVVGPSGCGKSTLLATLIGDVGPSSGAIRVGGADVLASDGWRQQVAWAPQRPWLTHGTVADNVRIGRPEARDDEIARALDRVGLGPAIDSLPLGVDTPLGEDGAGLSAGQRARVALARVVVSERPYVFLDEPTAHLDDDTEAVFLRTLRWLAESSTVVVVAHRPAVAAAADRVLTLPAPTTARNGQPHPLRPSHDVPPLDRRDEPRPLQGAGPEASVPSRFGRRTGLLLGVLSVASGVALTATAAWLITRASQHPPVLTLLVAIVAVRTFGIARPVLRYAERLVSHDAALRMLADRRVAVYDALVPLVPGRLGVRRGEVLASVVDDVDAYLDEQLRVRQPWWTAGLVGGGATLFAAVVSPIAGAVTGAVVVAAGVGALGARWCASRAEADFVLARRALSVRIEEVLGGARQLDLWQATTAAAAAVDRDGEHLAAAARRSTRGLALGRAAVSSACGLGVVAMAGLVSDGTTSAAMLALLVMLPLALADALLPAVDAAGLSVRTREARARLEGLTGLTPTVADPTMAEPGPESSGLEALRVTAGWDRDAVRLLSFSLEPGRRIGVVGPSGSGKSTVAALLLRFLDPRVGALTLGGTDLRRLRLDDVRRAVGLVDDDPYVFSSTLAENIRFARPGATDALVESALRQARLGDWLDSLPHGIGTLVGEGNAQVSGGERGRIGIARSLLADQPVLVLDEPTAHLDTGTARAVTDDLLASSAGRSLVWITHGTIGLEAMDDVVDLGETPAAVRRVVTPPPERPGARTRSGP